MIEGAAQASSLLMKLKNQGWPHDKFIGLGGVDGARFRGTVTPPARVYFVGKTEKQTSRMARYAAQAFCDGKLVFEMELLGVPL